jgi:NADPH:quinone reductase-like Zn-dependent oxidoreductase
MLAVTLHEPNMKDPLAGVQVGERAPAEQQDGWTRVRLKAASLNHHDIWSMRGVGVDPTTLPVVLGSDGAGIDEDGREVIIYPLLAPDDGRYEPELIDPRRQLVSDNGIDGTFAEEVSVPRRNLVLKPEGMSWPVAASLGTAWLTAYRMLFSVARLPAGSTILVQGAGGGVSTALVQLGKTAGLRVWVTGRSEEKRARAIALGADAAFEPGARVPERVDAVMESVGEATWRHSMSCVRPGGAIVVVGSTGGALPKVDLAKVFLSHISILGTAMGTREELRRLIQVCDIAGIEPVIDSVTPLADARGAIGRMVDGEVFGKVVLDCS